MCVHVQNKRSRPAIDSVSFFFFLSATLRISKNYGFQFYFSDGLFRSGFFLPHLFVLDHPHCHSNAHVVFSPLSRL